MTTIARDECLTFEVLVQFAFIKDWTEASLQDLNDVLRVTLDECLESTLIVYVGTQGALINLESNLMDDVFHFCAQSDLVL